MLLIRNGTMDTMMQAGPYRGDILIDQGRILQVEEHIDAPEGCRQFNAQGLRICPGMIDVRLNLTRDDDGTENVDALCDEAVMAGITTQGVWYDGAQRCVIRHGAQKTAARQPLRPVEPASMTDAQLNAAMVEAVEQNERLACQVHDEKVLRRLLAHQRQTGAALVLIHLSGCEGLLDAVVEARCEVILNACALRRGAESYAVAQHLQAAGVTIALTTDYPTIRLHHLPLCAGLCVRSGMDRQGVMRAITTDAARLLRVDDVCGSIAPGKRADLAIFDGDPLLLATSLVAVVSDGVIRQES